MARKISVTGSTETMLWLIRETPGAVETTDIVNEPQACPTGVLREAIGNSPNIVPDYSAKKKAGKPSCATSEIG